MEKNIKDYLHFYLGCECAFNRYGNWIEQPTRLTIDLYKDVINSKVSVKPMLRRIYTATYSEILQRVNDCNNPRTWFADSTKWYADRGFDVFELIEAGLAIDASKPNDQRSVATESQSTDK